MFRKDGRDDARFCICRSRLSSRRSFRIYTPDYSFDEGRFLYFNIGCVDHNLNREARVCCSKSQTIVFGMESETSITSDDDVKSFWGITCFIYPARSR